MKPALLTLSFLLFAFIAKLPLAFSQDAEEVLDINGNPIISDSHQYYILPAIFGAAGGGVRLAKTNGSTCPVTVVQDYSEVNNGLPVIFAFGGIIPGTITTNNKDLDIRFSNTPSCAISSKWVVFVDNDIQKAYVGIGDAEDHQGREILDGKFNIQKYNQGYKLVFCVFGPSESDTCLDIGRYDNNESGRRLVLTEDEPYEVVFIEAAVSSGIRSVV